MVDILSIRDQLNELPFKGGKRQVFLGRISDKFEWPEEAEEEWEQEEQRAAEKSEAIANYLRQVENELGKHDLMLVQDEDDPDKLYVVQPLRSQSTFDFSWMLELDLSWMREAVNWFAKITTVALEMVLPGFLGLWLDRQFGTQFLGLAGFAFGAVAGFWHLIQMTKERSRGNDGS